jgi:undecaprenyl-diphosphatase
MPISLDQILPSLESFGIWSYWIIGLAAMLEAFFVTGIVIPGTLVVDAGGILVQQGALDFFDLVWFVAVGSILGGEAGYWTGRLARRGLAERWHLDRSSHYRRAIGLFERRGGVALVFGRFLGPVSGLVPVAAAVAGMNRRQFVLWNVLSGFPYALSHVAFGYLLGTAATNLGPMMTRIGLFAAVLLLVLGLLWWIILRIIRLTPVALSILSSMGQAVLENPQVRSWSAAHPRTSAFLAHRVDPGRFSGLTATLLGAAALYILGVWVGTVFDFLMLDPIVLVDERVANLIHAFWSPGLLRASAHVTGLADWRVVLPLAVATLAGLVAWRRFDLLIGLAVTLSGELASVAVLKRIFDRPRSELGFFVETSGSFPSGHAALSVAFYGFLFFILWRVRVLRVIPAAISAATVAFLVGASRVYLIEHYVTDVINGWLVGALWLVIGIAVAEWWREARMTEARPPVSGPSRFAVLGLMAVLVLGAAWQVAVYDKARNMPRASPEDVAVASVEQLFAETGVPVAIESIAGVALQPVNVIVLARDRSALDAAMDGAGWTKAREPSLGSLLRSGWTAWTGAPEPTAPIAPYFWRSAPNDLSYRAATEGGSAWSGHHARFWRTEFVTAEGLRVFVGGASLDVGLDWGLLERPGTDIDGERDRLVADLLGSGRAADSGTVRLAQGKDGDPAGATVRFPEAVAAVVTLD